MSHIVVTTDGGISRYAHRLTDLADKLPRAEREGLQEGGNLHRTKTRRLLKHQMNTKGQAIINANTSGALAGDRVYIIRGTGKGLPIDQFPVRGGKKRAGNWRDQPRDGHGRFGKIKGADAGSVVAQSWGVAHRFKRSYTLAGGGYVASLPGTRRTRRLYGPAVGKEIIKGETAAAFHTEAPRTVEACVLKRIARLL